MADLNEVSILARRLMNEHGLGHVPFQFDRATTRFGVCRFKRASGSAQWQVICISISEPLVRINTLERCLDTVKHEIAHAKAGLSAGHGPVWRAHARMLGIKPERCASHEDTEVPLGNYNGMCTDCSPVKPIAVRTRAPKPDSKWTCKIHKATIAWLSAAEVRLIQRNALDSDS